MHSFTLGSGYGLVYIDVLNGIFHALVQYEHETCQFSFCVKPWSACCSYCVCFMQASANWKKRLAAVCAGITSCLTILLIILLVPGSIIWAIHSHCAPLYFGTENPNTVTLPDLGNLSSSEYNSLLAGKYELSNEYNLKLTEDSLRVYSLCVMKRHFTHVSACMEIGTDKQLQLHVICSPDMRPDCLSGAIVGHWFGLSLWDKEKGTVEYIVVDVDSSEINRWNLTNTTITLSSVWLDALDCRGIVGWTVATIIIPVFLCICGFGAAGSFLCLCCHNRTWVTPYFIWLYVCIFFVSKQSLLNIQSQTDPERGYT